MGVSFGKVCIIGVGLIGGSLAGVIKARGLAREVVGVGRGRENLETARTTGLLDSFTHDARKGVAGADLVVMCCPVGRFEEVAREIKPYLKDGAVVTDVGSVKGSLVRSLDDIFHLKARFVGAHPIAGSERAGSAAADPGLFEAAKLIVPPTSRTGPEALETVVALWEDSGANIVRMDPDEHDLVFALVSHLPHVAAYALVSAVAGMEGGSKAIGFAAGGFRDFTRIAASPADMWRDICLMNGPKILGALDRYQEELGRFRELIEKGDGDKLAAEFDRARSIRLRLD